MSETPSENPGESAPDNSAPSPPETNAQPPDASPASSTRSRRNRSRKRGFPEENAPAASNRAKPTEIANVHGVVENLSGAHAAGYADKKQRRQPDGERPRRRGRRQPEAEAEDATPDNPMEGERQEWSPRESTEPPIERPAEPPDAAEGGQVDLGGGKLPGSSNRRDEDRAVRQVRRRMRQQQSQLPQRTSGDEAAQKGFFGRFIAGIIAFFKGADALEEHIESTERERLNQQRQRGGKGGSKAKAKDSGSRDKARQGKSAESSEGRRRGSNGERRDGNAGRGGNGRG
ncbi:MAG: hypothetical protein ACFB20_05885 [Opitutales bacterium]